MITAETLQAMIQAMDKDGDGKCSKEEFKEPYMKVQGKKISKAEYDKLWEKIDTDKSGDVSVKELAAYYGFEIGLNGKVIEKAEDEMDDDSILEALRMAALLSVEPEKVPEEPREKKPSIAEKQVRVKSVHMKGIAEPDNLERILLEECQIGDVTKVAAVADKIAAKGMSVRVEDDQGKMPLHLLARIGDQAEDVIRKILDQGGESKKDINYTDLNMKTPLHIAAEFKQGKLLKILLDRGANPLMQNKEGKTVLHMAVQSTSEEITTILLMHEKVTPKKDELVKLVDNDGRTALHIASFRAEADMVKLLLDHGADAKAADKSGHKAAGLAGKANRRKSRELLEAFSP
uniref:EF-hand domain-containing protein n=1 Tax=Haptolina ericina TaxID=156174 RepID=A0A7S3AVP7_9EUKA|mmetsp:Transcript_38385/g.87173  ORF Transcript_38385/g.87173 Transcript_38385/m.87173 type:complete len:347 (+) Transcript_38385:84-1124(+)